MKISAKEYMAESFVPINNIIKIDLISSNTKFLSVHHSIFFKLEFCQSEKSQTITSYV